MTRTLLRIIVVFRCGERTEGYESAGCSDISTIEPGNVPELLRQLPRPWMAKGKVPPGRP
jgi:hypothetical protein